MNRTIKDATVNHIVSRPQATHLRPLRRPHSPCLLRSPPRTVAAPLAEQPVVDLVTAMKPAQTDPNDAFDRSPQPPLSRCCDDRLNLPNTSRSNTPSAWPK